MGRGDRKGRSTAQLIWGGGCIQDEDGIMTGLSPSNGAKGRGSRVGTEREKEKEDPNLSDERLRLFFLRNQLK